MQQPMVSVIVPVYKVEKYLADCIDSILNQTYGDFELILVDDGSPDKCPEICDTYAGKDSRVRVIHQPNGGVSSARNKGIAQAQGTFLMFVDSDDYLNDRMLEEMLSTDAETFDCIVSGIRYVYENPENNQSFSLMDRDVKMPEALSQVYENAVKAFAFATPCAKLYARRVILENQVHFDEQYSILEDGMFVYDFFHCCKQCRFLSGVYYFYRHSDDDSLMKHFNENADQALRAYYQKTFWIREYLDENNGKILDQIISSQYIDFLLRIYYRSGQDGRGQYALLRRYAATAPKIGFYENKVQFPKKYEWIRSSLEKNRLPLLHFVLRVKTCI